MPRCCLCSTQIFSGVLIVVVLMVAVKLTCWFGVVVYMSIWLPWCSFSDRRRTSIVLVPVAIWSLYWGWMLKM